MFQSRRPELVSDVPGILTPTTVRMPQLDNPWDTIVLRDEGEKC